MSACHSENHAPVFGRLCFVAAFVGLAGFCTVFMWSQNVMLPPT